VAYVYAIVVDDIIHYIGKGRGPRLLLHAARARRDAAKSSIRINSLAPSMDRNLVRAVRAEPHITELIIASGLSDAEAYQLEADLIADFIGVGQVSCGTLSMRGLWTLDCYRRIGII
jgi:hypothetical protein